MRAWPPWLSPQTQESLGPGGWATALLKLARAFSEPAVSCRCRVKTGPVLPEKTRVRLDPEPTRARTRTAMHGRPDIGSGSYTKACLLRSRTTRAGTRWFTDCSTGTTSRGRAAPVTRIPQIGCPITSPTRRPRPRCGLTPETLTRSSRQPWMGAVPASGTISGDDHGGHTGRATRSLPSPQTDDSGLSLKGCFRPDGPTGVVGPERQVRGCPRHWWV
jgi:hypothetical protein